MEIRININHTGHRLKIINVSSIDQHKANTW